MPDGCLYHFSLWKYLTGKMLKCWQDWTERGIKTFLLYQRKLTYHHWHTCLNFFTQIEVKISIFFVIFNGGTEIYFSFDFFLFYLDIGIFQLWFMLHPVSLWRMPGPSVWAYGSKCNFSEDKKYNLYSILHNRDFSLCLELSIVRAK